MGDMYLNPVPKKWRTIIKWAAYGFLVLCVVLTLNWLFDTWTEFFACLGGVVAGAVIAAVLEIRFGFIDKVQSWLGWE